MDSTVDVIVDIRRRLCDVIAVIGMIPLTGFVQMFVYPILPLRRLVRYPMNIVVWGAMRMRNRNVQIHRSVVSSKMFRMQTNSASSSQEKIKRFICMELLLKKRPRILKAWEFSGRYLH